ncbi:heterokaryon incompatibility protein-domain-containing protein [Xylaria telfairii]|nr:heterokaryon incompatibility protein-domain-containing protein [Xylaria telfairii]
MAGRDGSRFRADRYRHSYHDDTGFYENLHRLTPEHNSDDEHGRQGWALKDYEYEPGHLEIPSPTFPQHPIPKITVSETSKLNIPLPCHLDRPWTKSSSARDPDKSPPITSPTSSTSGSLGANTYQYEELRPLEFRLVRIFPKRMSTIKCEIIHVSLTDPPPYTAISYAWGDADDKQSIQIDNISISIAVSLFGALDALRKRQEDVFVWADALCIDQQNRDERSQQVQLMTKIYAEATEVAVWLGSSKNDIELAIEFLRGITGDPPEDITALLSSPNRLQAFEAVVKLFQRDYWKRLWVVQEVFNAKSITVYCGGSPGLSWEITHLTNSQVLACEGPNSLLDLDSVHNLGEESLLNVMRACRRKLTSEPRDRVFGVLGVLPEVVRREFPVNYSLSIKEIYTNVVDHSLHATNRLDVICESIHFPKQTGVTSLPSWVPDWSLNPDVTALGHTYDFAAAGNTDANWEFLDRRNEIEISAIYIDDVKEHGIVVGTLCTLADYLMAFIHWRAILLDSTSSEKPELREEMEEAFCRTLCLGQVPPEWKPNEWVERCYRVFATQIRNRLPQMPIDEVLREYIDTGEDVESNCRQFIQRHFSSPMMGRCFFLTKKNGIGMGTGFMLPGDIIAVPLGCRTPIVIREEGGKEGRFQFVGDAYLDGYMNGQAIKELEASQRKARKFVLI